MFKVPSKDEVRALAAAYKGEVEVIPAGKRTIDPAIRHCKCGCNGDWTEHTMRLGEKGVYSGY